MSKLSNVRNMMMYNPRHANNRVRLGNQTGSADFQAAMDFGWKLHIGYKVVYLGWFAEQLFTRRSV